MKLSDYWEFNIERFLQDMRKCEEEKERLISKLDSLSYLPSVNNESGVRSSDISDLTHNLACRAMEIKDDLADTELCEEALLWAMAHLTEEEIEIFNGFFGGRGKRGQNQIWKFIHEWAEKNCSCERTCYSLRRMTTDKMKDLIEERYKAEIMRTWEY